MGTRARLVLAVPQGGVLVVSLSGEEAPWADRSCMGESPWNRLQEGMGR